MTRSRCVPNSAGRVSLSSTCELFVNTNQAFNICEYLFLSRVIHLPHYGEPRNKQTLEDFRTMQCFSSLSNLCTTVLKLQFRNKLISSAILVSDAAILLFLSTSDGSRGMLLNSQHFLVLHMISRDKPSDTPQIGEPHVTPHFDSLSHI